MKNESDNQKDEMAAISNGNAKNFTALLWINTVLTAVLLPLLGGAAAIGWSKVDANSEKLNELRTQLAIVTERQAKVIEKLPNLEQRIEKIEAKRLASPKAGP